MFEGRLASLNLMIRSVVVLCISLEYSRCGISKIASMRLSRRLVARLRDHCKLAPGAVISPWAAYSFDHLQQVSISST